MNEREIRYYSINENFKVVENGKVTSHEAFLIIDKYIADQKGLKGEAGYVISKSLFGFSIDEKRFIELAIDDENNYRIKLECPEQKSFAFFKVPSLYQKEIKIKNRERLKQITDMFFTENIDDFKIYFNGLGSD